MKIRKKIDKLSNWEWSTLVASWRYYEYRSTIASATFPEDIVERYWRSGKYDAKVLGLIARQFAKVDHGLRGESDWSDSLMKLQKCDATPWCLFFAFCNAWCDGFRKFRLKDGSEVELFYCDYTKHWHPKVNYIDATIYGCYVTDEQIDFGDHAKSGLIKKEK